MDQDAPAGVPPGAGLPEGRDVWVPALLSGFAALFATAEKEVRESTLDGLGQVNTAEFSRMTESGDTCKIGKNGDRVQNLNTEEELRWLASTLFRRSWGHGI